MSEQASYYRPVKQTEPHSIEEYGDDPVGDEKNWCRSEEGVPDGKMFLIEMSIHGRLLPEPEHKIYLLIDDVLREDTQAVVDLFSPGSSNIWDVAGGDCGEHSTHRVSVPTPPVNIPFFQLKLLKNYQKNVLRWNIISSGVVPDGHLRVLPVSVWRGVILDNLNPVP